MTRLSLQEAAQWRLNMSAWAVSSVLQMLIAMAVWMAVAAARGGRVGGYDAHTFVGYFVTLLIVRELTYTWMPYMFADQVRTGQLNTLLLRPAHPFRTSASGMAAYRVQTLLVVVPAAVLTAVLLHARVGGGLVAISIGVAVLPVVALLRMVCDLLLATLSLRFVRIDGVRGIYYLVMYLLGGQFAPLDTLPHTLRTIAHVLPFYWMLGFPTELAIGRIPTHDVPLGLAVMCTWIAVVWMLLVPAWRRGIRRWEAVDA